MHDSIAAVILSAGLSSRMGNFKPLLKLGNRTAIELVISAFSDNRINPIIVVTGHRRADLVPVVESTTASAVFNSNYIDGMFSSVQTGIAALPKDIEAFFVHPVDIPLISSQVVRKLCDAYQKIPGHLFYPCYKGRRGRPPLIPAKLIPHIQNSDDRGGLRTVLAAFEPLIREIEVDEPGILYDMDNTSDYKRLCRMRLSGK